MSHAVRRDSASTRLVSKVTERPSQVLSLLTLLLLRLNFLKVILFYIVYSKQSLAYLQIFCFMKLERHNNHTML